MKRGNFSRADCMPCANRHSYMLPFLPKMVYPRPLFPPPPDKVSSVPRRPTNRPAAIENLVARGGKGRRRRLPLAIRRNIGETVWLRAAYIEQARACRRGLARGIRRHLEPRRHVSKP